MKDDFNGRGPHCKNESANEVFKVLSRKCKSLFVDFSYCEPSEEFQNFSGEY